MAAREGPGSARGATDGAGDARQVDVQPRDEEDAAVRHGVRWCHSRTGLVRVTRLTPGRRRRPWRRGCARRTRPSGVTEVSIVSSGRRRQLVGVADAGELRDLARRAPWRRGPSRRAARRPPAAWRGAPARTGRAARPARGPPRGPASYGAIAATTTVPPCLTTSPATQPIRRMLRSRCSRENVSSLDRWVRTTSPSRTVTGRPSASSPATSASAIVDLPAPERPVRKTVTPGAECGHAAPVSPYRLAAGQSPEDVPEGPPGAPPSRPARRRARAASPRRRRRAVTSSSTRR